MRALSALTCEVKSQNPQVNSLRALTWPFLELPSRRAFKDAVTLCVLAVTLAFRRGEVEGLAPAAPTRSRPQGLRPFGPAQGPGPLDHGAHFGAPPRTPFPGASPWTPAPQTPEGP